MLQLVSGPGTPAPQQSLYLVLRGMRIQGALGCVVRGDSWAMWFLLDGALRWRALLVTSSFINVRPISHYYKLYRPFRAQFFTKPAFDVH